MLCQIRVDFLFVPAPSAVLLEVGLHIGIGDGRGPELLLAVVALSCRLRVVILRWLCCCCCCRSCGCHRAFGGLGETFLVVASKLVYYYHANIKDVGVHLSMHFL